MGWWVGQKRAKKIGRHLWTAPKFQHQNLQKSQGYCNFRLDFIYGPLSDKAV